MVSIRWKNPFWHSEPKNMILESFLCLYVYMSVLSSSVYQLSINLDQIHTIRVFLVVISRKEKLF